MEISDYMQNGEKLIYKTEATQADNYSFEKRGVLACSDIRLLFASRKSILDLRIPSIDKISVEEPNYLNSNTVTGIVAGIIGLGLLLIRGPAPEDLSGPLGGAGSIVILFAIFAIAYGLYYANWTLTLETACSEHRFKSSDSSIQSIAHAIRGVE